MTDATKQEIPLEKRVSRMITGVQPRIVLSGNADRIFEELAAPEVKYDFTVTLTLAQIADLLGWVIKQELLQAAEAEIKGGGSIVPGQLVLEFTHAVGAIREAEKKQ